MDGGIGWARLASLSAVAAVNDAIAPLAALLELVVLSAALSRDEDRGGPDAAEGLAAYGAVISAVTFALNIFNFVVIVNMSGVARAVGASAWAETGRRVRTAFAAAAASGALCAAVLIALEVPVYALYALEPSVEDKARTYIRFRVMAMPFQLVVRAAGGVLQGFHRLHLATGLNSVLSLVLVASNVLALSILDSGLHGLAVSTLIVYVMAAGVSVALVFRSAPNSRVFRSASSDQDDGAGSPYFSAEDDAAAAALAVAAEAEDDLHAGTDAEVVYERLRQQGNDGETSHAGDSDGPDLGAGFSPCEFLRQASNMIIRSFLLSFSLWLMSVFASRLGTSQMAAHQIAVNLWTLISYIVDGFADVATMLGAKFLGQKAYASLKMTFNRLIAMSLAVGVLFTVVFLVGQDAMIGLFTSSESTVSHLRALWPLLACMQSVNSLVFAYDGVIYATERYDLVRNIMIVGCLVWFVPALIAAYHWFHTLVAIWAVKAVLNAWRAGSAVWITHLLFYPRWVTSADQGSPHSLSSPFMTQGGV